MLNKERPAAGLTADGADVSIASDTFSVTLTPANQQPLPSLIAMHIGRQFLAARTMGGAL